MGKLRWYKRDPVAALEGMSELTLEERGAYNTVLDLIYARDGAVDDDDRFIAGWLRCDIRVWRRIRARLITLGKIYVDGQSLRNSRADAEISRGLKMVAASQEAGRASARKRATSAELRPLSNPASSQEPKETQTNKSNSDINENNALDLTTVGADPPTNSTSTTRYKKDCSLRSQRAREADQHDDWPKDAFDQFWKIYPHKVGRKAALKAFVVARRSGVLFPQLMFGLDRYINEKPPDRNWCNPATWLNQGRWDDQPASATSMNGHGKPARKSLSETADELIAQAESLERQAGLIRPDDPFGSAQGGETIDWIVAQREAG